MINLLYKPVARRSFYKIKNVHFNKNYTTAAAAEVERRGIKRKMKGLQIHAYGDLDELQLSDKVRIPVVNSSDEILVKVKATGVNPIDIAMLGGYGSKMINLLRCNQSGIEFPLILGREFSGTICQKGLGTSRNLQIGDSVWGVVPIQRNGSHAEYVVVPESCVSHKPDELTSTDAGGLLYAGLTAWSGIFLTGQLGGITNILSPQMGSGRGKRILVLGGAGGVGSAAIQILKAEHATVISSCSTDAVHIVKSLGVDHVIDYNNKEESAQFAQCGPYDMILDCAGLGANYAQQFGWSYKSFITFSSPLLRNVDEHGVPCGMLKNVADILEANAKSLTTRQGCVKWAYFIPSQTGIRYLTNLVNRKKFLPLVDSTFSFSNAIEAYQKVKSGHLRGKIIINLEETETL